MKHKTLPAEVKTGTGGELYALASTYQVDRVNDRVMPGAFTKTLAQWRNSGDHLPLLWNHNTDSPLHFLGVVANAHETERGLEVRGVLDLEDNELARQAHKLLQRGSVKALSIGYYIEPGGQQRGNDGVNELHEIDLREISVVLTPANPGAVVEAVKSCHADDTDDDLARRAERLLEKAAQPLTIATFELQG